MGKTKRREAAKVNAYVKREADRASAPPKTSKTVKRKKGRGWAPQLETEIAAIGLRVHEVDADGSCFFRSLADQLEGRGGDHRALRRRVVAHIADNRELYEPFVEDDEPFDDYVERMGEEGTWAGHLELQAASVTLEVNLRVYQAGQPPWTVRNFPDNDVMTLHLSYHDGMHYNSVRLADDYGDGPPEPIPLVPGAVASSGGKEWSEEEMKRMREGTGCEDEAQVTAALEAARGDVDAAIEALVEAMYAVEGGKMGDAARKAEEEAVKAAAAPAAVAAGEADAEPTDERLVAVELEVSRGGKGRKVAVRLRVLGEDGACDSGTGPASPQPPAGRKKGSKKSAKEPSRNSRCPCGSTRKYKNCCGASKAARARAAQGGDSTSDGEANGAAVVAAAMQTLYI